MSENKAEITKTLELFPESQSYADVYDHYHLLNDRTILAHAIHLNEEEIELLLERKCGLSHCPVSNLNLSSGLFRLVELAERGLKIGLGSDISGGYAVGMLSVIREASIVSRGLALQQPSLHGRSVSLEALFYLATLGGAHVCGLENRVGKLEGGYEFDALLINTYPATAHQAPVNPGLYVHEDDTLSSAFEKWIFCGDDRNISSVFVHGRLVSGSL